MREAKLISQLNHPHICTLYDVGEQDGIDYLVMEYIARGLSTAFDVPTGHVVFVQEQSLWAIAFDVNTLETKGEAIPLVERVQVERGGATQVALADNGTLVYVPIGGAGDGAERVLVWVVRQGNRTPLEQEQRDFSHPRFSPNGRRMLLQIAEEGQTDV